jgi:two-component system, NarL family, response regulator NreC
MITVCIVDDYGLFCDGVRALLATTEDLRVVGEARAARDAYLLLERSACDVVLMDQTLPGSDGVAAVRELRRRGHRQPVLMVSIHAEHEFVVGAFAAGANGYLLKQQRQSELFEAIRAVAAGDRYLAPQLCRASIERALVAGADGDGMSALSPRERETFDLLVRGCANEDIARELFISVRTVETHRAHLLRKLELHSLTDLVRYAVRKGLLSGEAARFG